MTVKNYLGLEGVTVNADGAQDVLDALDQIHTQILDRCEAGHGSKPELVRVLRILETAMDHLTQIEGVSFR